MKSDWVNYLGISQDCKVFLRAIIEQAKWQNEDFGNCYVEKGIDIHKAYVNSKLDFGPAYRAAIALENNNIIYTQRNDTSCSLFLSSLLKYIKGTMEEKGLDKPGVNADYKEIESALSRL